MDETEVYIVNKFDDFVIDSRVEILMPLAEIRIAGIELVRR